jgi:hypothetical protein
MTLAAHERSIWFPMQPCHRRGEADGPHHAQSKPHGFPGRPIRDARSAEWELMNPLSLTPNVRGHGFQMHHYRDCAGDPLSRGV